MNDRKLPALLALLLLAGLGLSSCTAPCDYPSQRFAKIRLVNAMPDVDKVSFWINGKLMYADFPYDPPQSFPFGYFTKYADGTPLATGKEQIMVTRDAAGRDTLMVDSATFMLHRATIVAIGRGNALPAEKNTKKIVTLDDELRPYDANSTYIRFIQAIPDLDKLDVYWKGKSVPDATIQYGVVNSYSQLDEVTGLKITEAGDSNNVISFIPYNFVSVGGFLMTTIIRGRTNPIDHEHTGSIFALSDIELGNSLINFETFGVRVVNCMRDPQTNISMFIRERDGKDIRNNFPDQQNTVINIPHDSVSKYLALSPIVNTNSKYFFSTNPSTDVPSAILDSVQQAAAIDDRYTFIAFDPSTLANPTNKIDHVVLKDTVSLPSNPALNRVRIVMLNADHNGVSVTFGGKTFTMNVKDVAYIDIATGTQQLQLDASTQSVMVGQGRPMTIYLLPAQQGEPFPIKAVME